MRGFRALAWLVVKQTSHFVAGGQNLFLGEMVAETLETAVRPSNAF